MALVSGANRGIGLEIARGLLALGATVGLGCRDGAGGAQAARQLDREGRRAVAVRLDIADCASVADAMAELELRFGGIDILVNNAAIFPEDRRARVSAGEGPAAAALLGILDVNALGAYRLAAAALPGMVARGFGRIVNLSSEMGRTGQAARALSDGSGIAVGYRMSKAALNMLTQVLAAETAGTGVLVNAASPGVVRTRMGRPGAVRAAPEGADTAVRLASLPPGGPTGRLFRERRPIPW